jgi:hypothetical protein
MSPFFMNRTLMSCPPMSQMTSTSPKKCTALIMCATVSTMLTSARIEFVKHVRGITRGAKAKHFERRTLTLPRIREAREHSFVSWIGLPFDS